MHFSSLADLAELISQHVLRGTLWNATHPQPGFRIEWKKKDINAALLIYLKFLSYLGLDQRTKTKHNPGKPNFGSGPSLQGLSARGRTCKGLPVRALLGCCEGSGYHIICILHVYSKRFYEKLLN